LSEEPEARRVIGTHDYNWPELAPSTLARKAADTPLLETGELRDSIGVTIGDREASVGSNNDKAIWHELGTVHIPPRSFLMGAATHVGADVPKIARKHLAAAFAGRGAAMRGLKELLEALRLARDVYREFKKTWQEFMKENGGR
jgi:hypothetical protein